MREKAYVLLLLLFSSIAYLEWGDSQRMFLFELEAEVLRKSWQDPLSVLHPLTVLPFAGQCILLVTLFQNLPSRRLVLVGMLMLGLLMYILLLIGIVGGSLKIMAGALPYTLLSIVVWRYYPSK
jgi:hypothetical protein